MALGSISFREIEAYQTQTHAMLSAWDVKLIRRLDVAVRAILTGTAAPSDVSVSDTAGVKALFKGIASRKARSDDPG